MKRTEVSLPQLGLIAATRGILGAGLGLLLSDRLADGARKAVGWTMLSIGALSTIPLAMDVLGRRERNSNSHARARDASHNNRETKRRQRRRPLAPR
jgi:hypothetical protein